MKKKSENPRASWACENQLRPDKPSGKRHFLTNTKLVIFFTKAYSTLLKKTKLQGSYQPYIWWSSSVLTGWCLRALKKKPFICRQNYLSNSTWECLWEITPYTISLVKQPQDAICCYPNCSRERLLYHGSLSLHCMLLSRSNAKCCLHR